MIRIISQITVLKTCVIVSLLLILSNQGCNIHRDKETGEKLNKVSSAPIIHVVFTGEENGYLEPCGCSESQLGGF
jgi:hypothetical protein